MALKRNIYRIRNYFPVLSLDNRDFHKRKVRSGLGAVHATGELKNGDVHRTTAELLQAAKDSE